MDLSICKQSVVWLKALVLLMLFFYAQPSSGQTFSSDFNSSVTNDLYFNGWDFSTAEWSLGAFWVGLGNSLGSGNLRNNADYTIFSGYSFINANTPIDIDFNFIADWSGNDNRRPTFTISLFRQDGTLITSGSLTLGTGDNSVLFATTFSIPGTLISSDDWYYFTIAARRQGGNNGGSSFIYFDNFVTDLPTNSEWPELSPLVTVTDNFSVSDAEINEEDQATITFTFSYDEVLTSPSERAVRGLEYQIDLHPGLDYVSHTITGASAGPGTTYNSTTGVLTIEAIQKAVVLTLEITVEGVAECIGCEVEVTALNANELQPMTGFGDDIEILSVLPIELVYFLAEALPSQKAVRLDWATAMELENDFFTIERSRDGINFYKVAEIPGAGTHSGLLEYSFTDITALEGTSYYRLKQTDIGGRSFSYSEVVRVQLPFGKQDITPFPNPVRQNKILQFSLSGNWEETLPIELMVFSQNGTLVQRLEAEIPLERVISLDIPPNWAPGIYLIKVRQGVYQTTKRVILKP
jgi:hypothetical protein